MIEQVTGKVIGGSERAITLLVAGLGISLSVPRAHEVERDKEVTLFSYLHWNQDRGPSLFGFLKKIERTIFLMLIDCHKIGPQMAMQILSQIEPRSFLEIVSTGQERELSKLNGIGAKKARQIVSELQEKATSLLGTFDGAVEAGGHVVGSYICDVSEALKSLGYSSREIVDAMRFVDPKKHSSFDQMMRAALTHLSQ